MTICIIHKLKCPPLLPWKYHYHFFPLPTQERANYLLSGILISLCQDFNPEHWTINLEKTGQGRKERSGEQDAGKTSYCLILMT
jgi:hypothetical protein